MKKIRKKTARRWLRKNACKIAKMELGVGASKNSCFHKQMILCQASVGTNNA